MKKEDRLLTIGYLISIIIAAMLFGYIIGDRAEANGGTATTIATTAIFIDNRVFCPVCKEKGMTSIVYVGGTWGTLMYSQPYYDEEGYYHYDDPNTYTTSYRCSKGHEWSISRCGDKEWESITKDTGDEEEEYELLESYDDEGELLFYEESEAFITLTPTISITFGNGIGKISWETGVMTFEGDANESAKIFFEYVLKPLIDEYIEWELNKEELIIEVPEQIMYRFDTSFEYEMYQPEWFLQVVDTDMSKCLINNRLRIDLNGKIYWIILLEDSTKPLWIK